MGQILHKASIIGSDLKWKTGRYYSMSIASSLTTQEPANGNLYAAPVSVPNNVVLASLNVEVTILAAANGVARMGLYNDAGGVPGTLRLDAGTVDTTTTGAKAIGSLAHNLPKGVYWVAFAAQGAPATLATFRATFAAIGGGAQPLTVTYVRACFSDYTGTSGALPASFTVSAHDTGEFPFVQLGV